MTTGMHSCPNCGAESTFLFNAVDENRHIGDEEFVYARCTRCGVISIQNPPEDMGRYYESAYYEIPTLERLKKLASGEDAKMSAILPYAKGSRLLEIGPAFGIFAMRAKAEGFEVEVIERDSRCCDFLAKEVGVTVQQNTVPEEILPSLEQHDVIALWHVFEHLEDPFRFFDVASENLATGGILVLGVPNPESRQFRLMGASWPHLDAPRHTHLMSAEALIERGRKNGLELCRLTSNDADAQSWNRFGWQRWFMNRLPGRLGQAIGFVIGAGLALVAAPFERTKFNGSAYTITLRKS